MNSVSIPFLFLFLLIRQFNPSFLQLIKFDLRYDENKLLLQGGLGTPSQNQIFALDINHSECISFAECFDTSTSKSYLTTQNEISFINKTKGFESSDYINLPNFSMKDFRFIQLPTILIGFSKPHLGLGKGPGSFIDQLYNKGFISHKMFHINKDTLYLGGSPFSWGRKCQLITSDQQYSCNLNKVVFSNEGSLKGSFDSYTNHITIDQKISFNTNVLTSSIPIMYLGSFRELLFKGLFENSHCLLLDDYNYKVVFCLEEVIESLPNIHLILGDIDVMIKTSELWMNKVSEIIKMRQFLIEFDLSIDRFVFGYSFIRSIPITFSEEENYLSFHSINVNEATFAAAFTFRIGLFSYVLAIIILVLGILMAVYVKRQFLNSKLNTVNGITTIK